MNRETTGGWLHWSVTP